MRKWIVAVAVSVFISYQFVIVDAPNVKEKKVEESVKSNEIRVYIDGENKWVSLMNPVIEEGIIYVPIDSLGNLLKAEVTTDNRYERVTIEKNIDNVEIKLVHNVNSNYIFSEYYDGKNQTIYVNNISKSNNVDDETMLIPFNEVIRLFGYEVNWIKSENEIHIQTVVNGKEINILKNKYLIHGDYLDIKEIELDLFYLTNEERIKAKIEPLEYDVENANIARIKSKDMHDKKYFDHESPLYGSPFEMLERFGMSYRYAGENLAAGFKTPKETVKGWMKSPGHRENLLRKEFERVGVGFYEGPNGYKEYYTQIFTTKY